MSYPAAPPPWGAHPGTAVVPLPVRQSSTLHLVIAWSLAVLTLLYLLPWAIGATRNKQDVVAIALINIFLGWSLIGWVVALVMACSSNPMPSVAIMYHPGSYPAPGYPAPGSYPAPGYPAAGAYGPPSTTAYPSTPPALYGGERSPELTAPFEPDGYRQDSPYSEPTQPLPPYRDDRYL